jgi:E3 ubiquitin-protein ligase UBR1
VWRLCHRPYRSDTSENMTLSKLNKHLGNSKERMQDPVERLTFALDTMPNALHGLFNPPARARILTELYAALWGSHYSLFLAPNDVLNAGSLLSSAQARSSLAPHNDEESKACQHVFKKGECCFRCKSVVPDPKFLMDSDVLIQRLCYG